MKYRSFVPSFGKIFLTSLILVLSGTAGLVFVIFFSEPTLGPRWLFFFFLTICTTGIAMPFAYVIQRRVARQYVPVNVLLREALLFSIFIDLLTWLQLGRILTNLMILILAGGFFLLEFFLRMAEKATFQPESQDNE
ncbi:hypothetical protein [Pelolinea submarina]|uniref:Uncharacterized protein n=1 Tax=Pelolinea submarina TaxID=913107 RepID=A0A347ZUM3_9CHLR|nr:hypothetical protein [Pelolinea submarina]REG10409.1 hypothetical protein DFR64_0267 [Pelolinea submarina]BBB49004.1 hypothetical protein Pelsub_P2235 [Pelolinea submarina]